jgi:hypothetical protein
LDLLRVIKTDLSSEMATVQCESPSDLNYIEVAERGEFPLRAFVGGELQSDRFIYQSRRVEPTRPGHYILAFEEDGELLSRRFFPTLEETDPAALIDSLEGQLFVVARQPGEVGEAVSNIRVLDDSGNLMQRQSVLKADNSATRLDLGDVFCSSGSD